MTKERVFSLAVALWSVLGLVGTLTLAAQPEHGRERLVLIFMMSVVGVGLFVGSAAQDTAAPSRKEPQKKQYFTLLLSGLLWVASLPVAYLLWREAGIPVPFKWSRYPYLDKRWLIFLYWISILSVIWFPMVIGWLWRQVREWKLGLVSGLPVAEEHPQLATATPEKPRRHLLRILLALVIATAAFGPPWNVEWSSWPVNPHETLHWGGLQAIDNGFLPYVGPASVNYGPGAQIAMYAYMTSTGQFSIVGFREFFAVALWLAVFIFCAFVLLTLPAVPSIAAILAMLIISPVAPWGWTKTGVLEGFFGWANLLRNIATLVLSLSIYSLIRKSRFGHPQRTMAVLVGALWGGFAYFAQENLFGGLLMIGLLLGLAVAGELLSLRGGISLLIYLILGFMFVWIPFLSFYLWHGELSALLHNYFLVPDRFLKGYANTPYSGTLNEDPFAVAYYTTPVLATLAAASAVFRRRPFGPVCPLSAERFLVVSVALAYLAAFPSAMLRSDDAHFLSTTFAVPVLMAVGIFGLVRMLRCSRAQDRFILISLATWVTVLAFLPSWLDAPKRLSQLVQGRLSSLSLSSHEPPKLDFDNEPARRHGPILARSPRTKANIEIFTRLKEKVGDDPVLVFVDIPYRQKPGVEYIYEGFVYFMADLFPGPIFMERSDMVANSVDKSRFLQHFEQHIDEFEWVVCLKPVSRESDIFKKANPGWTMETLQQSDITLYLFGRSGG